MHVYSHSLQHIRRFPLTECISVRHCNIPPKKLAVYPFTDANDRSSNTEVKVLGLMRQTSICHRGGRRYRVLSSLDLA